MGQRYYFKLRKPLEQLCKERGKPIPTRDQLSKQVHFCSFRKEEYNRDFATECGVFSDGMLEAISNWLEVEPHELVELTLEEPDHVRNGAFDSFQQGWIGICDSLRANREFVAHERSYLQTEQEVRRAAIEWLIEIGWQISLQADKASLDKDDLLRNAIQHLGFLSDSEFPDLVVSWWRANPKTCVSAFDLPGTRCGVSYFLPLKESPYYSLRKGIIQFSELSPADIEPRSTKAILIGATDFSYRRAPKYRLQSTRAVIGCLLAQLCHGLVIDSDASLQILACGITDLACIRLKSLDFRNLESASAIQVFELETTVFTSTQSPFFQCLSTSRKMLAGSLVLRTKRQRASTRSESREVG